MGKEATWPTRKNNFPLRAGSQKRSSECADDVMSKLHAQTDGKATLVLDHTEWPPTSQHVQHAHWMRVAADCPRHDTAMRTRHTCTHSLHAHWPQLTSWPRSPKRGLLSGRGQSSFEVVSLAALARHTHTAHIQHPIIHSLSCNLPPVPCSAAIASSYAVCNSTHRWQAVRGTACSASCTGGLTTCPLLLLIAPLTHLASVFAKLLRAPESNPRRSTCDESNASSKAVCSEG